MINAETNQAKTRLSSLSKMYYLDLRFVSNYWFWSTFQKATVANNSLQLLFERCSEISLGNSPSAKSNRFSKSSLYAIAKKEKRHYRPEFNGTSYLEEHYDFLNGLYKKHIKEMERDM